MNQTGLLIAIEGIDGSGKSTLAKRLFNYMQQTRKALLTKEPGDSALGKKIRTIVQEQDLPICPKAEYLLFAADRAQHFDEVVIPALASGTTVISDRMADSSLVYQGFARGLDISIIKAVNTWAMNDRMPDITLFVSVDPEKARERLVARNEKLTAFERENISFMQKVHEGFCALYQNRNDVILINGENDEETVFHATLQALKKRLSDI
jgi:dTMP kinase